MREKRTRWPMTALGIVAGAALGILIGVLVLDAVGLNLGLAIVGGAALGVVIGAAAEHLRLRGN